jgi:hypothetical protein
LPYIPPPERLPGFPRAERVRPKTQVAGRRRPRWRDEEGYIYEWDFQHGTVERYDRRGNHLGEFDPETGRLIKHAVPGRQVEP